MSTHPISSPSAWLAALTLSLSTGFASAQSTAPPASNTAERAPPVFRSAFESYQPYTDEKTVNWKEANDQVGRIGGWREYAKEAQSPQGQGTPAASTPAHPHAGHGNPAQVKP